jgi:hypothetical protein
MAMKRSKLPRNGPVNDHRPVLGVVRADVFQVEVLRLHVIELDRGALHFRPIASVHVEVDLRPVKAPSFVVQS